LYFPLQRLVFVELSVQEAGRDDRLFFDAPGREEVEIYVLVGVTAELVDLDERFLDQCLETVISPEAVASSSAFRRWLAWGSACKSCRMR
jgi:hypothetical protein